MADLENPEGSYKIPSFLALSISTGSAASPPDLPRGLVAGTQHQLRYGAAVTCDQAAREDFCEPELGDASSGTQKQCLCLVSLPGSCLSYAIGTRVASLTHCCSCPAALAAGLSLGLVTSVRTQQGIRALGWPRLPTVTHPPSSPSTGTAGLNPAGRYCHPLPPARFPSPSSPSICVMPWQCHVPGCPTDTDQRWLPIRLRFYKNSVFCRLADRICKAANTLAHCTRWSTAFHWVQQFLEAPLSVCFKE